jgi:Ca-activated chloride channel family protein
LVGEQGGRTLRPLHLLLLIWLIALFALAGPTWQKEPAPFADDAAGLVVLLKVSGTMNATDIQPSRLERAKHKLRDLLQRRKGAATAVIVYSGSAHLLMPLTRDDRIISTMVDGLTPALMPVDGDVLAQAVELAQGLLQRAAVPGSLLVMADAVAPAQVEALSSMTAELPLQFLALQATDAPADPGLQEVADRLGASVVPITADQADVERLARRAQSEFTTVAGASSGQRWHDAGYPLLFLLALLALMWSRKGWLVR